MKLTISNIAWPADDDPAIWALLRSRSVAAIEVAPTRVWPNWEGATVAAAQAHRSILAENGLNCSSFQSLLYGMPSLNLFGSAEDRKQMREHLIAVGQLAAALGAGPIVFGSPKNRDRGALSADEAFSIAGEFFGDLGAAFASLGVCLCIEPNPVQYDCNFVTNSRDGARLVRAVNSPGFRLHLDAAGMHMAEEDNEDAIIAAADVLEHFHVSEPYLANFAAPVVRHASLADGLKKIGWNKWVSIEMRPAVDTMKNVDQALGFVHDVYGAR